MDVAQYFKLDIVFVHFGFEDEVDELLELYVFTGDVSVTAFNTLALGSVVESRLRCLGTVHLEGLVLASSSVDGAVVH